MTNQHHANDDDAAGPAGAARTWPTDAEINRNIEMGKAKQAAKRAAAAPSQQPIAAPNVQITDGLVAAARTYNAVTVAPPRQTAAPSTAANVSVRPTVDPDDVSGVLALARCVGLKGFEAPASAANDPPATAEPPLGGTGDDSASYVLALAQRVGLRGFTDEKRK